MIQHVGVVRYQQGQYEDAAAAFRRAVALSPGDPDALRNLAAALDRLGRGSEATGLRARASALAPEPARVVAMRVSFPAELARAYLEAPGLRDALRRSEAGEIEAALDAYWARLRDPRAGAAAHLGAANELVRWHVALRLTAAREPVRVPEGDAAPARPTALFSDWRREADGRWAAMESVVAPPAHPGSGRMLLLEARHHYEQAVALGAGAAARIGLATVAVERGEPVEAARQLAAARALDPTLPAPLVGELESALGRP
jgi:tetratricopeptide (TPR) repeat protein